MNPKERTDWDALHFNWVLAGYDPARFWEITMREADREMRAAVKKRERDADERMWLAWHIVALDRTPKLPRLESLLLKNTVRRQQSPEELLVAMKSIFLAFGGDPAELNADEPS